MDGRVSATVAPGAGESGPGGELLWGRGFMGATPNGSGKRSRCRTLSGSIPTGTVFGLLHCRLWVERGS